MRRRGASGKGTGRWRAARGCFLASGGGAAVVSETLNSNTLNLLAGLCAPALRFGSPAPSRGATLAVGWMLGATLLSVVLAYTRGELRRWEGTVIILTYLVFAALLVRLG